jgi:hypothetical protein
LHWNGDRPVLSLLHSGQAASTALTSGALVQGAAVLVGTRPRCLFLYILAWLRDCQAEMRTALESFFRAGQKGGKSLDRFDELMKALDEDQPTEKVEHKKVFEEDREYNQGAGISLGFRV